MLITRNFNTSFACKSPVGKWENRWISCKDLIIYYVSWDSIFLEWHLQLIHQARIIHINVFEEIIFYLSVSISD